MSAQQPIESILLRQVAGYLALPIWMFDDRGDLVFFNSAAEALLGASFDEIDAVDAGALQDLLSMSSLNGDGSFPLVETLETRRPANGNVRMCCLDGQWRDIGMSALPIVGQSDRFLGVFAAFWEIET